MNWRSLVLQRAPGVVSGLSLEDCSSGLNIVLGRNGIGKTTLSEAARALLWQEEEFGGRHVTGVLRLEDGEWVLEREGKRPINGRPAKLDLPDARFRGCFHLSLDALLRGESTDDSITAEVRKEMEGGYELHRVCAELRGVTVRKANAPRKKLDDARSAVRTGQQQAREVLRAEEGLPALDAKLDAKEKEASEKSALEDLIRAAQAELQLAEIVAVAGQRDPLLARFENEHQLERLKELDGSVRAASQAEKSARDALEEAQSALDALGLPEDGIDEDALGLGRMISADLKGALGRITELREELSGEQGKLAGAEAPVVAVGWSDDELTQRAELVDDHRTLDLECEARRAALEGVPEPSAEDLPDKATRALMAWLAAGAGAVAAPRAQRGPLLVAALLITGLLVASLAGLDPHSLLWVLPLALVLYVALVGRRPESTSADEERAKARRLYEQSGIAAPAAWDVEGVQARLEDLVAEWAAALQQRTLAEFLKLQRTQLTQRESKLEGLGEEIRELRAQLGVGAGLRLDLLLLLEAAKAERKRRALQAQLGQLERDVRDWTAELEDRRAEVLGRSVERSEEAALALQRWAGLEQRVLQLPALERVRKQAAKLANDATKRLRSAEDALQAFLKERGLQLADVPAALLLEKALEQDLEERRTCQGLKTQAQLLRERWEEALPQLCELDLTELKARLSRVSGLEEEAKELREKAAEIRADVKKLEQDQQLSEKQAALDQARDVLESVREEVLQSAVMQELMGEVRQRHRDEGRPAVLKRADRYFREFTRDDYQLEDLEGEELRAIRVGSPLRLRPVELSSGTRTQLLMALRLAFAEEAEQGAKLPIFLDEALLNSDPERFAAIAGVLGTMVKDGRQVFYLTAEPREEVELRRALPGVEFKVHDLGDGATQLRSAAGESLELVQLPQVPAPQGEDFRSYAAKVGMWPVDGFASADALHLLHLYSTRLETAHAVLIERREQVGAVYGFLERHPEFAWSEAERGRFEALRQVADRTLVLWRIGRAPRLTAEQLHGTKFSRTTKLDEVLAVAAEVAWDAAELMRRLDNKAVKGLSENLRDELREELEELELLPNQDPLEAQVLRERVLDELGAQGLLRALDSGEAAQLIHQLLHWLDQA
jgi:uncharacterized protein YhaN